MNPDKPARLDPAAVQAFVGDAHGDLDAVRVALESEPQLVNAAWDWGGGDWETGLGAAAHMGRRDVALFLLEHGARLDVFAAAMLGYADAVRHMLDAFPGLAETPGPHGIPLIAHAQAGGEEAREVVALLESRVPARR